MARTYAECLSKYTEGSVLKAVAVGSRAPALARDYGVDAEPDLESLLRRDDIAAVVIATPETVHLDEVHAAAAAGKAILLEKPMAPTLAHCDTIIETCEQAGVRLMVVKHWRYREVHRKARAILDSGRLGRVLQLRNNSFVPLRVSVDGLKKKPFYLDPAGGGYFFGWNTHNFDLVRWLAGSDASSIFSRTGSWAEHQLENLSTMAHVEFDNGVIAQVWVNAELASAVPPQESMRTWVMCEHGVLDLAGPSYLDLGVDGKWERVLTQAPFNPRDPMDPNRLDGYARMLQEFIDAVREDREPAITGRDGRAAVELCVAAKDSSKSGRAVDLPLRSRVSDGS